METTMIYYPTELSYTVTHEWIKRDSETVVTIGITEHAQDQLGDIVFVDLPELNSAACLGEEIAVIESVKTAADIYSPISGEVIEINDALIAQPELINQDSYHDGWLFRIQINDDNELAKLLSSDQYQQQLDQD